MFYGGFNQPIHLNVASKSHSAFMESEFLMKCRKNRKGMERSCFTTIPTFRCLIHHAPKLATRHGSIELHRLHAKCPKNQSSHLLHNCVDNIYIYSLYIYTYDLTSTWLDYMIWYYIYIYSQQWKTRWVSSQAQPRGGKGRAPRWSIASRPGSGQILDKFRWF